jgi:hypothetical protein
MKGERPRDNDQREWHRSVKPFRHGWLPALPGLRLRESPAQFLKSYHIQQVAHGRFSVVVERPLKYLASQCVICGWQPTGLNSRLRSQQQAWSLPTDIM